MTREATILRETAETRIEVTVNLDGAGQAEIATGIGFFDHMLCAFARHGRFDLKVSVRAKWARVMEGYFVAMRMLPSLR